MCTVRLPLYVKPIAVNKCVILYIKLKFCLFVCLYLIQIHISKPIWTILCTHLPLGLEETVGCVWTHNIWSFRPLLSGASAESWSEDGCRRKSSATALYPSLRHVLVWRHGHDFLADDSALWVMHRRHGEVNGLHVCKNGNPMRQEGNEQWFAIAIALQLYK